MCILWYHNLVTYIVVHMTEDCPVKYFVSDYLARTATLYYGMVVKLWYHNNTCRCFSAPRPGSLRADF